MDVARFDRLSRALGATPTRRATFGLGVAGLLGALGRDAAARRKKHKKKKCKSCGPCRTCKKGKCRPKAAGTSCGTGKQCFANGACTACDVCLGDCAFTSLQAAHDAISPDSPTTFQVCPGIYPTAARLFKPLTVIGAGSGAGGTVLDSQGLGPVIELLSGTRVELRGLTIRGARTGPGIGMGRATLTLQDVHITDNHSPFEGGGITSRNSNLTLIRSRITGNSAGIGGGIYSENGSVLLTANSMITGNSGNTTGGNDGQTAGGIHNQNGTVQIIDGSSVTGNIPFNCSGTAC